MTDTRTAYQLDINNIQTLDDVKVLFDALNLTTYDDSDDWDVLQKYFTKEIEIPQPLTAADLITENLEAQQYAESNSND